MRPLQLKGPANRSFAIPGSAAACRPSTYPYNVNTFMEYNRGSLRVLHLGTEIGTSVVLLSLDLAQVPRASGKHKSPFPRIRNTGWARARGFVSSVGCNQPQMLLAIWRYVKQIKLIIGGSSWVWNQYFVQGCRIIAPAHASCSPGRRIFARPKSRCLLG